MRTHRVYMEIPEIGDACFRYDPEDIGCVNDIHSSGTVYYINWKADGDIYDNDLLDEIEEFELEQMHWSSRDNRWEIYNNE